jgi:fucose permease
MSRRWRPILLSYAAFVLIGVNSGGGGVLLLAQMNDYGVGRATIGITFFVGSAGFVLAGLSTGALIERFGVRTALAVGGGAFVLSGLYLATRPPFAGFVLVQLVAGFSTGVLEAALNVYLAELPDATKRLNQLHAFFGVGALVGPVLAAWIVTAASWTTVYLVLALAGVPLIIGFLLVYPGPRSGEPAIAPPAATAHEAIAHEAISREAIAHEAISREAVAHQAIAKEATRGLLGAALRRRGVLLGATMLSVYVGFEIAMGDWSFGYLVQARGVSTSLAGYSVSGYWLGLTLGRFLISPFAERIRLSAIGMMYACLAGVTVATVLAWVSPTAALASGALMLLGFFIGPIYPTTMSMVPRLTEARLVPTAVGVMTAASVVGGSLLPWLAGAIGQVTGIWTLMPFTLALAVIQLGIWRPIARRSVAVTQG